VAFRPRGSGELKKARLLSGLFALVATPAFAPRAFAQDAAKGQAEFKKCKACHMIAADDSNVIQKGGKTGPNLYGVVGRAAAATDFNCGSAIRTAGATGLV